jgi:hypothetical protein
VDGRPAPQVSLGLTSSWIFSHCQKFSLSFPLILHSLPAFFMLCCTLPHLWTPPWTPLTLLDTLTPTTNTPNDAQRTISQMSAYARRSDAGTPAD